VARAASDWSEPTIGKATSRSETERKRDAVKAGKTAPIRTERIPRKRRTDNHASARFSARALLKIASGIWVGPGGRLACQRGGHGRGPSCWQSRVRPANRGAKRCDLLAVLRLFHSRSPTVAINWSNWLCPWHSRQAAKEGCKVCPALLAGAQRVFFLIGVKRLFADDWHHAATQGAVRRGGILLAREKEHHVAPDHNRQEGGEADRQTRHKAAHCGNQAPAAPGIKQARRRARPRPLNRRIGGGAFGRLWGVEIDIGVAPVG